MMEEATPQEEPVLPSHHIPTTAELRAKMKKCPWCGHLFKTDRGLKQHQARNTTCQRKKLQKQKFDAGYASTNKENSVGQLAAELFPSIEARDTAQYWIPLWLLQLIRYFAEERHNLCTLPWKRVSEQRYGMTPQLRDEFELAKDNPTRQKALEFIYHKDRKWRIQEKEYLRTGRMFSPRVVEEIRVRLGGLSPPTRNNDVQKSLGDLRSPERVSDDENQAQQ